MGIPVLILGESGSGKSTSLRTFEPDEVGIFNVASKPLPFRKKLNVFNGARYQHILDSLKKGNFKRYVIDDSQYLMSFELFDRVQERGYEKFTEMAVAFRNLLQFIITNTSHDCIVYLLHHVDQDSNTGKVKAKTVGKMLDDKLTIEGLFSVVLLARADGQGGYSFDTQTNGMNPCKSPMEMFEQREIDNDLKLVDIKIREYWGLNA